AKPRSLELRDQLALLYIIMAAWTGDERNRERAKELLKETESLDPRDPMSSPGLLKFPARRYIDVAAIALQQGRRQEALDSLHKLVQWYTGDAGSDLLSFEITMVIDQLHGIVPIQTKYAPYYVPSLEWPRL